MKTAVVPIFVSRQGMNLEIKRHVPLPYLEGVWRDPCMIMVQYHAKRHLVDIRLHIWSVPDVEGASKVRTGKNRHHNRS